MGGAQLYVLRRALYLQNKGFDVYIVVGFDNGNFPLQSKFNSIPILCVPEVSKPYVLSYPKNKAAIDKIKEFASINSDTTIESHTLSAIEWGEIISSSSYCKHLAYPLSEIPVSSYKWQPGKRLFYEKLERNEFWGLSNVSLKLIFGEEHTPNNYVNVGFDEAELADKCSPYLSIQRKEDEFVIATVTRLDKTYVEVLISDSISLAKEYPNQVFVLLIAGGSRTGNREEYLFNKYRQCNIPCDNLRVLFTGYITTLGKDLFQMCDVFVGTGLAAINAISQSCLTIMIDESYNRSIGFFGTETRNFGYGDFKDSTSIFIKLKEAYLMDDQTKQCLTMAGRDLYLSDFYTQRCFEKLDNAVEKIINGGQKQYINVNPFYALFCKVLVTVYSFVGNLINDVMHIFHRDSSN